MADEVEDWLRPLVTPARPTADDPAPARFSPHLLVGSAQHALGVDALLALGVTAVLNLAPRACVDVSERYAANSLEYVEIDAEDEPGYGLLDLHLEAATAFLSRVRAADGLALVHCFAGVKYAHTASLTPSTRPASRPHHPSRHARRFVCSHSRSAAVAIAFTMLAHREPLALVVERCFAARPFILTNASFREQLCALATAHGLDGTSNGRSGPAGAEGEAEGEAEEAAYELGDPLGDGAFAVIYTCTRNGCELAAKVVSRKPKWIWIGGRSTKSTRAYDALLNERAALDALGPHPRVVRMEGWVEEAERAILLLEIAPGGDLEQLVATRPDGVGEGAAHSFASDLFAALAHCHSRGVTHRDVKLANLLLAADGSLRLADFGHAAVSEGAGGEGEGDGGSEAGGSGEGGWSHPRLFDKMGTKSYCAPEIIACDEDEGYLGPPSDVWSAGICWFALLSGRLPFAIADEIADWRFARVAGAQAAGRSACAEILSWTQMHAKEQEEAEEMEAEEEEATEAAAPPSPPPPPWGEQVARMLDAVLSVDPDGRPSAAQAVAAGWRQFHAVGRSLRVPASPSQAPSAAATAKAAAAAAAGVADATDDVAVVAGGAKSRELSSRSAGRSAVWTRSRSREASFDARLHPPQPQLPQSVRPAAPPQVCSYRLRSGSPGLYRKRRRAEALAEAQEERTCVWRGVRTETREVSTVVEPFVVEIEPPSWPLFPRYQHPMCPSVITWRTQAEMRVSEMQSAARRSAPSTSMRYSNARYLEWLMDDTGKLPLVMADVPFKVARANNNNYGWGGCRDVQQTNGSSPQASDAGGMSVSPESSAALHLSRRTCPWAR